MTQPTRTTADMLKANTTAMRKRDVIDVREAEKPKTPRIKPTPEQMSKGSFEKVVGSAGAYRRLPLLETLAKQSDRIDQAGLAAMRWYRDKHDTSAVSPTRCALNDEGRGGGVPICIPFEIAGMRVEDLRFGSHVALIESRLGSLLPTVRSVVIEDKSFGRIAIERFGSRKVAWIDQEKTRTVDRRGNKSAYVDKLAPISGRHRQIIADEFSAGLKLLVEVHTPYVSTACRTPAAGPVNETEAALIALVAAEPLPAVDPDYLDENGRMLSYDKLAGVIRAKAFGDQQIAA